MDGGAVTIEIDPTVIQASAARGDTRYPYAAWMPIPEAATQPKILPRLLIWHSQAGPALTKLESIHAYITRTDITMEPTFILDMSGRMAQVVDIFTRADCNAKANPFSTSVETQDEGHPTLATTQWTEWQCRQLAGLAAWMHLHPSIRLPLELATKWDGSGIGPHRAFPEWSVYVGKTCPGDARVAQIPSIIARARQIATWTPPPTPEEDDMAGLAAVIVAVDGDASRAEAVTTIDGATGKVRMRGFNTAVERDDLIALGVERKAVTADRYDRLIAQARA